MKNTSMVVIAIVAVLAMFGVVMVAVATTMQLQQAEAISAVGTCAQQVGTLYHNGSAASCRGLR